MDLTDDSSLLSYLVRTVPDPRSRRGQSFEWWFLLAILAAAVAAGADTVRGLADWAKAREAELVTLLQPRAGRVPSLATVERTLWSIGLEELEQALAAHTAGQLTSPGEELVGVALDGKVPRGVVAHGGSLCLVSLVAHESGLVLGQMAVPDKTGEIPAAPVLLAQHDLAGRTLTVDALHCQRDLAQFVIDRDGHYVMGLKANQPTLHQSVVELFETVPTRRFRPVEDRFRSAAKAHGRYEERLLETSTLLNDYLDWPGVAQVMRRHCRRTLLKTGKVEEETTYFVTSLSPQQADAEALAKLIRGHWTIENKVHHVRDVSFREDRCGARTGSAAQALAALRNGVLNALRLANRLAIAQALRYNAAYAVNALATVGALRT